MLASRVAQRFVQKQVEIQPSPIHGQGVFAKTPLPKGTWLKDNLPVSAYRAVDPGEPGWDGPSAILRPDGKIISHGGPYGASWQDHLNHSEAPNATFVPAKYTVALITTRDIEPGEEITINYYRHLHPADEDLEGIQ